MQRRANGKRPPVLHGVGYAPAREAHLTVGEASAAPKETQISRRVQMVVR